MNPTSAKEKAKKDLKAPAAPEAKAKRTRPPKTRVVEVEVDPSFAKGRRPTDEELQQRQDAAYRLRLLGKTPEQISEVMGIAPRTVREYVARAKERQIDELKRLDGKAGVLRQFSVLNYVLEETLDAWDRSKRTKKTKTAGVETKDITVGEGGALGATETKKRTAQREEDIIGDVQYLDRALKASEQIRGLLGLDAPEVKRLLIADDPVTKDLSYEDIRNLPTEELLRRYRATAGIGKELG